MLGVNQAFDPMLEPSYSKRITSVKVRKGPSPCVPSTIATPVVQATHFHVHDAPVMVYRKCSPTGRPLSGILYKLSGLHGLRRDTLQLFKCC